MPPVLDLVFTDEDLAEAGAVDGKFRVVPILRDRAGIAEDERAPAQLHHLARALVVGGIKAERLRRRARRDECLNEAERRPRLLAARLDDDRRLERDGGQPERIHRGRVARHHQSERVRGRVIRDGRAALLAVAAVDHVERQPAREAVEHDAHVHERMVDLLHVAPDHHMRQAAGGGERLDVLLARLRVALVAKRQLAVQEEFARLRRDLDELLDRELLQRRARLADPREVFADDAGIDLADMSRRQAGAVIEHSDLVEALVGFSATQRGKMRKVH